ncbi:MAG: hypothetical protein GY856_40895 [bacterium]|nr:hypothetical protein [bacterium]
MMSELLIINGIDGSTGRYLLPPLTLGELAGVARGLPPTAVQELRAWRDHGLQGPRRGLKAGLDPKQLAEAGWGVIFAADADPAIREALAELLRHRAAQAGSFYREYAGEDGYRPGESKLEFLARHHAGPGPADPERVPYYLLIVGDPQSVPYRFQYQLDVQYGVGRLHFATAEEYASYAQSVVEVETREQKLARRAVFFGVRTPGDPATELGTDRLVVPLAGKLTAQHSDWTVESILAGEATKARLGQLLAGREPPALVFTMSHGVGFHHGDPRQLEFQGSLLCQDWPGPDGGAPLRDHYFAAEDLGAEARLRGLIAFHFACFAAGTPHRDDFVHARGEPAEIAPHAFVARLPQRLLGHPGGGALAAVGHIERAWGLSFQWPKAGPQPAVFESAFERLMDGHPLGSAMEVFNLRYAELSCELSDELEALEFGKKVDEVKISWLWTARNDARNYVVLGDPAVRLAVGADRRVRPTRAAGGGRPPVDEGTF